MLLLQGKATLSTRDLLECFDWSEPHSSPAVGLLRTLLGTEGELDEPRRFLLLRWCTGRNTLPICGLERKVALLRPDAAGADMRAPEAHTCSHEIELPSYSSIAVLREQLSRALLEFEANPGFQQQ